MKLDKVEICMAAVERIKTAVRNIGMVCSKCGSCQHVIGEGYYCKAFDAEIPYVDGFCNLFHFRDEAACADLWKMCMEKAEEGSDEYA